MPELHTSELPGYVAAVNAHVGDFDHPDIAARYYPLELRYDAVVDQALSPYSDAYYRQQLDLYREIAGRELDQQLGELHHQDIEPLVTAPNPMGIRDVSMAEHIRCLSTMLSLADLAGSPEILDMGAGHGLSSEIFAFAGARVHAIDIDPDLGELSRRRAAARGLDITRSDMNFDDLSALPDGRHAAAFFFQSLHHCLRPWDLIAALKPKLTADGVIGFTGEPIQSYWWRDWGLRLDQISLFVARQHGWFESGWSHAFIRDCFERNGMTFTFFTGGHIGGEIGIATVSEEKRKAVLARAAALGLAETKRKDESAGFILDGAYASLTGEKATLHGRPAFRQRAPGDGTLLYGPYATLDAGTYEFAFIIARDEERAAGRIELDVVSEQGARVFHLEQLDMARLAPAELIVRRFTLPVRTERVEIRLNVLGAGRWTASLPVVRRIEA